MGGAASSGESNDDLIDSLIDANFIRTPVVERVFRCVDRGNYFPDEERTAEELLLYRDVAWRRGNHHISAPCIYSEVLECLDLQPGLSFLNIGSGTGYLNTMAGLLLGAYGTNHGVELFEDMVDFSKQRLTRFMADPKNYDEFEFCPPEFYLGNGLLFPAVCQYDRVYCGASCEEGHELDCIKRLVKIGGKLITPLDSHLVLWKRISDCEWSKENLMSVSFASLLPETDPHKSVPVPVKRSPHRLDELSRFTVRAVLRGCVMKEHPELTDCAIRRATLQRMRQKRKALSEDSDDGSNSFSSDNYDTVHTFRIKYDSGVGMGEGDDEIDLDNSCDLESEAVIERDTPIVPEQTFSDHLHNKFKLLELPKPLLKFLNFGHAL